jgi:hypothetical protein
MARRQHSTRSGPIERLRAVPPEYTEQIARRLKITNRNTGVMSNWEPNNEQIALWRAIWSHVMVYVLKVRQIGASTAVCLDDVLWTSVNDSGGHRVRCGIVVDTDAKARERIQVCWSFIEQLGLHAKLEIGRNTIVFPNGSELIGMTAGGRRAGASMTFHRFHFTELPFWRDPGNSYTSLMQALVVGGQVIIETTMGVDDPLAKDLWVRDNDFHKLFFSFEEHHAYKMEVDRSILSEELEDAMRREGFEDPEAMMFWQWLLLNRCGGDPVRCYREYPQRPEHSWLYAEGRWVRHTPRVVEPVYRMEVSGTDENVQVDVYRSPDEGSGQYVIGVDVAAGLDRDASSVAVVDKRDLSIMASFVSPTIKTDDLAVVAVDVQRHFTTMTGGMRPRPRVPSLLIETNGVGIGTYHMASSMGAEVSEVKTSEKTKYDGLLLVKRYVEAGSCFGPARLADECDELRVEDGKFLGPKDLCMALGFCYDHITRNRFVPDISPPDPNQANFMRALKAVQDKKRR